MKAGLIRVAAVSLVVSMVGITASITRVQASQPSYFDQSFGTDGVSTIVIPPLISDSSFDDVQLANSGKLLTLINVTVDGVSRLAIGRRSAELVIDTSFGLNGRTDFVDDLIDSSMTQQSDGRILLAGTKKDNLGWERNLVVRRYFENGQVDTTFGTQGVITIAHPSGKYFKSRPHLSVTSSGRIIVGIKVGYIVDTLVFFALDPYGNRDQVWGYWGAREISPSTEFEQLRELESTLVLGDGSVIGVYSIFNIDLNRVAMVRVGLLKLTPAGNLDETFDGPGYPGNGMFSVPPGVMPNAVMSAITPLTNGNFILAGIIAISSTEDPRTYGVAQFRANGSIESTFGVDGVFDVGVVVPGWYLNWTLPRRVLQTADGNVIFSADISGVSAVISVHSDGLGFDNYLWTNNSTSTVLQLSVDGTIIMGGQLSVDLDHGSALIARMSSSGVPIFGPTGNQQEDFFLHRVDSVVEKSLPQSNGSTLVLARAWEGPYNSPRVVVVRLTDTGDVDTSFGSAGFRTILPSDNSTEFFATDIAVQTDGKIVVLMEASKYDFDLNRSNYSVVLMRLLPNGDIDQEFGNLGEVVISDAAANTYDGNLVVLADNKILLTGSMCDLQDYCSDWFFRFTAEGVIDTSFRDSNLKDGQVEIKCAQYECHSFRVILDSEGRLVVWGGIHLDVDGPSGAMLARYLPNGTPDTSFSDDGFLVLGDPYGRLRIVEAIFTTSGEIVAVASQFSRGRGMSVLIRVLPNGTLNTEFNFTGMKIFSLKNDAPEKYIWSIAANSSGYTVVGSIAEIPEDDCPYLGGIGRIRATGEFDETFGTDGMSFLQSLGTVLTAVVSIDDSHQLVSGSVCGDDLSVNGIVIRIANSLSIPTTEVPTTVPSTVAPTLTVPPTEVPTTVPSTVAPTLTVPTTEVPTTVPVTVITTPVGTSPSALTLVPKIAQAVTLSPKSAPVKLVIAVSQATILKNMKLTVPKGGVAKFSIAKSSAKVCKVVKKQVLGTATGTCRVSVTIKTTSKKSVTKSMAFKVSG